VKKPPSSRLFWRLALSTAALLLTSGCAVDQALRDSATLRQNGDLAGALARVDAARRAHPDDLKLRAEQHQLLERYSQQQLQQADQALSAGDEAGAIQHYQALSTRDPGNTRAEQGLRQVEQRALHRSWLAEAEAMARQDPMAALDRLGKILAEEPDWQQAIDLRNQLWRQNGGSTLGVTVPPALKKPVALSFRNQNLTTIFDAIARMTGINFIIDREVSPGLTGTIQTQNASAWDAINLLLATNQLAKKMLNGNTLLIYPARPDKVRAYQDQAVRTFYLSNAEPKQVFATLKQVLKPRELAIDERVNAVVMRDDPALLAAAERLVQSLDLPQSEVTLDVEVLEVNSTLTRDLGVSYPDKGIGIGFLTQDDKSKAPAISGMTDMQTLKHFNGKQVGVNFGVEALRLNLYQKNEDIQTLANPKIRVKNHEKATIKIGEKVPVITTTTGSSGMFAGDSVNYEEVGLKLEVQPSISLGREISVKVALTVSDVLHREVLKSGTTVYTLGNRSAETVLSTRDNVTQVLGGLIKRGDNNSRGGLPYLSQIPLLDSLFGSHSTNRNDSEIILLITPHIVRQFSAPPSVLTRFQMGPEGRIGDPLELQDGSGVFSAPAGRDTPPDGAPPSLPPPAALPGNARALSAPVMGGAR